MAWPASQQSLFEAFRNSNVTAINIKREVQDVRDQSVSSDTIRLELINLQRQLHAAIEVWNTAKGLSGIVAYVRDQFDDPTMDVAAEFNGMVNAATDLRDWINTNFPTDTGTSAVLERTLNSDGSYTELVFTSGQLSGFRTESDTFLATIS